MVIGNRHDAPIGTDHLTVTVYSALRLDEATIGGQPVPVGSVKRFGVNAYPITVDVPAGQSVTVQLKMVGHVDKSQQYHLTVVRQPTVHPDTIDVSVTGRNGFTVLDSPDLKIDGRTAKATVGDDRVTSLTADFSGP